MLTEALVPACLILSYLFIGECFEVAHEIKRREWEAEHPASYFIKWGEMPARFLGWPVFIIAIPARWLARTVEAFVERKAAPARIRHELVGRK